MGKFRQKIRIRKAKVRQMVLDTELERIQRLVPPRRRIRSGARKLNVLGTLSRMPVL